ncbi:site-specific integrase [Mucilaginibacter sp. SP1R1]|uniref:site-specific integrase n=1 Tax=Mucilaginibacter sp. SP1R1 TaxID=2723091 RepID=UPI00161235B2|nr:site-specific integrase [Mucilaginibacter sp. SP1R1]MBB6149581.1 site-specific recombinase XerD [Mucilaginibacter sp. SP1R1]
MKSNQNLSLLFWHRKSKADKKGFAPIICRISIDGEAPEEISIRRKANINCWDLENKKVLGTNEEAKQTNFKILEITVDLNRHFILLRAQFENVKPLMVKNLYHGLSALDNKFTPTKEFKHIPTLLQVVDKHIANFEAMVNKGIRSNETLKQWNATRKKIKEFLITKFDCIDCNLADIEYSFATSFYNYLIVERKNNLSEATAKKQIKNLKEILTFAETNTWISKNPILKFKCGSDETDIPPLEYHEVERIWSKEITVTSIDEVRDAFIFQCFTGFAFQDVYALATENIVRIGIKGERWLIKDRGKTGVSEMVPILPIIETLLDKYKSHACRENGLLIPVNNNAKYNFYLKELAVICGIKRELNTHLARHTFADLMLNVFGFSLEEVSKMLGHKTVRTTQRYAKVRKNKISKTLARVKGIVFDKDGKLRKISI